MGILFKAPGQVPRRALALALPLVASPILVLHFYRPDGQKLIANPDLVVLGALRPGERAQRTIKIHNPHRFPVAVRAVESGCECPRRGSICCLRATPT
jgi:hypothetical protein